MSEIFKILKLLYYNQKKYLLFLYLFLSLLSILAELTNILILKYLILSILNVEEKIDLFSNFELNENELLLIFIVIFIFSNVIQYSRDVFNKFYSNLTDLKILNEYYESILKMMSIILVKLIKLIIRIMKLIDSINYTYFRFYFLIKIYLRISINCSNPLLITRDIFLYNFNYIYVDFYIKSPMQKFF